MLTVTNMTVSYSGIIAVHNVTFQVQQGEIVSVIGSNGAGKTSTIRGISGLVTLHSDGIFFQEEKIDRLPPHEIVRRGVVQVPEGRGIFGRLNVLENLVLGNFSQRSNKNRGKRLELVLGLFPDLKDRLSQSAGTLSGGQQQMLAIGRGLMSNPKLLMLDEPSLGIMPIMVDSIFATIEKINQEGVTILLVEQRARESLEMADRGYVFQTGRVVLEGTSEELLNNNEIQKHYLGM
jgi:branched-chain amino acid transport system ATP-binding protein